MKLYRRPYGRASLVLLLTGFAVPLLASCARQDVDLAARFPGTDPDLIPMIAHSSGGYVKAEVSEEFNTRIHGRVVSAETGKPVPDSPVAACFTFPTAFYGRSYGVVAQRTDSQGQFCFENLRPGMWILLVQDEARGLTNDGLHDEWPSVYLADTDSTAGPVDVTAFPGKQLTLHVTDDRTGEPIKNAWAAIGRAFNAVKLTDAAGSVTFRSVSSERAYVRVVAEGYAEFLLNVALGPREEYSYDVALNPGGAISGRLVDEGGAPIAGAYIRGTSYSPVYGWHDVSATDGSYRLVGLAYGETAYIRYGVPMGSTGWLDSFPQSLITSLEPGESEKTVNVTIPDRQLHYNGVIEGRVMDPDGKPVEGALVSYGWLDDIDLPSDITDAEGRYRLEDVDEPLAAIARFLRVRADGFPVIWSRIEPGPSEKPRQFDVRLHGESHAVSGRVVEADGSAPRYPVVVTALDRGIPVERTFAPAGDGRFEFSRAKSGVQLALTQGNSERIIKSLPLGAASPDFELNPVRAAKIRVFDATTGKPIPEFQLRGSYWNEALGLTVLNEGGEVVIRARKDSPFATISVHAPGYQPSANRRVVLGAEENPSSFSVELTPSGSQAVVAGVLSDADGRPLADKEVSLVRYATMERGTEYGGWGNDLAGWDSVQSVRRSHTDSAGRFSFNDVPADGQVVDLIVSDPSVACTRFMMEAFPKESWSELKLQVDEGAVVRGRWNVDLAQRPPRVLYLYRTDPGETFWFTIYVDQLTGEFEFPVVPPGNYRVEADPSTFADERFELAAGEVHEIEWGFEPLGRVTGQLSAEMGRRANRLVMLKVGGGIWSEKIMGVSTDAEGRYEFNELVPGKYTVAVGAESAEDIASDFNFFLSDQWWLSQAFGQSSSKTSVSLEVPETAVEFDMTSSRVSRGRFMAETSR